MAITATVAAQLGVAASAGAATTTSASGTTASGGNKVIKGTTRSLGAGGTTAFVPQKAGAVGKPSAAEIQEEPLEGAGRDVGTAGARQSATLPTPLHKRSLSRVRAVPSGVLSQATKLSGGSGITPTGARLLKSYDGISEYDQRTTAGGNQFTVEPPDQALCVGNGYVVQGVNDAVRIDTTAGKRGGVMSLNAFFHLPVTIDRTKTPPVYGPSTTDPTCVYDSSTKTFYFVILELALTPSGDYTGANSIDIAVTKNPMGSWRIYRMPVQDDGSEGTPVHPNCPCIGDYPHIGFDRYGFYVTTNEYPFFTDGYNSAQIYAFDKAALGRGSRTIYVTQFDTTGADQGRPGFTVWPAQSPSARDFNLARGGTAYFLSSNAAEEARGGEYVVSRQIVIWTLTGSSTFNRSHPSATIHVGQIGVRPYAIPPLAPQKAGPAPLLECLNDPSCRSSFIGLPPGPKETLSKLDANDTRMQQVMYVRGKLYGALDTAVKFGSETDAGIAWYVVQPVGRAKLTGRLVNQGQFGLPGQAVTYPAIGVADSGRGVMAFTLSGRNYYPSAAFAGITAKGVGPIRIAAAGKGPQDGFTGYAAIVGDPPRPRWGDYGAASVVGGNVWIASEYIGQSCTLAQYLATGGTCGNTRTALANWGTRVSLVRP